MVLYLLMNVSFLAALTPAQMAGSELVAADAIAAVFGGAAGTVVVVASLLILISSANVNFLGLPRVAYGLSRTAWPSAPSPASTSAARRATRSSSSPLDRRSWP